MRINITDELDKDTLLSHIILHNMSTSVAEQMIKNGTTNEGVVIDVKITANGIELDLKEFIDYWQSQVDRIIHEKAAELVREKFADINDMLYDLEQRMEPEIEKRLEDWEKENDDTRNSTE